jgi:hypothetical protein
VRPTLEPRRLRLRTVRASCDNTGDTGNTCTLTGNIAYTDGELLDLLMVTAAGNRLTFCVEYDLD